MRVYLDHAATTAVRPEVSAFLLERMSAIGNPSSVHAFGQQSRIDLENARAEIAAALDCHPSEVVFTSGGTEGNNLAIIGLFEARNQGFDRPNVLYLGTEHHAVLESVEHLEKVAGARAVEIPVGRTGQVDLDWLAAYLEQNAESVALVSLILANNESGTIVDVAAVSESCKRLQIPVHTDAVAAVGHAEVSFRNIGVSTLAFTGHKIGAPIGVGALLVGRGVKLQSQLFGGSQERGIRPGTQNVPGAEALALAVSIACRDLVSQRNTWEQLRSRLIAGVLAAVPDVQLVGEPLDAPMELRLSNIVDFMFPGCAGDSLLFLLDSAGVAISNGSACSAGVTSASHVLVAHGFSHQQASGCVRVSFGWQTTEADVDAFLEALPAAYAKAQAAGFVS